MGRSVAVVCPKGGVGKTTVAVNLAAALADKGFRCLIIGVDPQCGVISCLGLDRFDVDYGLLDFFDPEGSPERVAQATGIANLDFMTSNVWSREEEEELLARVSERPQRLAEALAPFKTRYDFLFMDCPPNLGPLTWAALHAADAYMVPVQAEELAYRALPRFFDDMDERARQLGHNPELLGILINQYSPRTRLAISVVERIRGEYGDQVFQTMIPRTVRLAEVALRGRPVNLFNRSGLGARTFAALADELLAPMVPQSAKRSLEITLADEDGPPALIPVETPLLDAVAASSLASADAFSGEEDSRLH